MTTYKLFDVKGRRVARLLDERRDAGAHELPIDTDRLSAGVYYLKLETGADIAVSRVVYLR